MTRAQIVLLVVGWSKPIPEPVMHCRWESGLPYFCPVRALAMWWARAWAFHLLRSTDLDAARESFPDRKVFLDVTPAQLVEWLKVEAERRGQTGINAYSLRVGGARQLNAHLKPGLSQEALRAVGVWADDSMARYYGGASIESFREHSRMMVQPTTILPR